MHEACVTGESDIVSPEAALPTVKFPSGTVVRSVDNPAREGTVTNAAPRERPSGSYVQVRWNDGGLDYVHEDELQPITNVDDQDPYALVRAGRYGRAADLRRNLTYVHLSGRLANLVYAMGITTTDFYAHQYRPLLALLDSPTNGLLIADEVGLGKTIEAGLIWTELRARFDMRRLLVVCPAMLREKWRDELRIRFGVEARITDAAELLDELQQPKHAIGEGRAWIISYNAARPPKDWKPNPRTVPAQPNPRWRLATLFNEGAQQEPLLDMVVFDEAHYMRNRDSMAWKLGEILRDVSEYRIMLSATPINLKNQDLFSLLNLIDPDHFSSEDDFARLLHTNRPLVAARDVVLNRHSSSAEVIEKLKEASEQRMLSESRQLQALLADPPTDELLAQKAYRAQLADSLERLNLLSHVLTRTRKRDVQTRRIKREVHREAVTMTVPERELYDLVTEATRRFALSHDVVEGFLLAMPQRQVTSCPAAVAHAWARGGQSVQELAEDLEDENEDLFEGEGSPGSLRDLLAAIVPRHVNLALLREKDSKFAALVNVLRKFLADNPSEKVIVFTTFRATASYLAERLSQEGIHARLIWGNQTETKQSVINEFRDSTTLKALVSTEVASEGVDLQFCKVLVNFDLPWNPTRIEQRIGRIDRLGQKAEKIHIWNLFFADTIDDRIVTRLLHRLHIFEEALGETEPIVGGAIRKLESELLSRPLTKEEEDQQIDQAAQALENLRVQREELERNAAHMMAHGQRVLERIEAAQELSKRVTNDDLYVFVRDYLTRYAPGHRFTQEGLDAYLVNVQLPSEVAGRFDEFLRAEGLHGKTELATGASKNCRFLNRISEPARRGEEIVHQFHPLIRFIASDLRARNEHFYSAVAVTVDTAGLPGQMGPGTYVFVSRIWTFKGVRDEEHLVASAVRLEDGAVQDGDDAEQLLQHARIGGKEWIAAGASVDANIVQELMERAEEILDARYREALQKKKDENADRARFQLAAIEAHLTRRVPRLRETLVAHVAAGRPSLAKATQGLIDKLTERMNVRRERIHEQEKIVAERNLVCAGVVRVMREGGVR